MLCFFQHFFLHGVSKFPKNCLPKKSTADKKIAVNSMVDKKKFGRDQIQKSHRAYANCRYQKCLLFIPNGCMHAKTNRFPYEIYIFDIRLSYGPHKCIELFNEFHRSIWSYS